MQTETMKLNGMTGEACADKINSALLAIKGVNEVTISLAGSRAAVQFDEDQTSLQELRTVLVRAGYGVETVEKKAAGACCGGCGGAQAH
jgi:copper chaperone CopZ